MDSKQQAATDRQNEDYEPESELVLEGDCDTRLVHLPGFQKVQLKLYVTKTRTLLLTGDKKGVRLKKEYRIPTDCDTNRITATFNNGILYIRQPKPTTPPPPPQAQLQQPPPAQPQKTDVKTQKQSVDPPPPVKPQKSDVQGGARVGETASMTDESKQTKGKGKNGESMDARSETSEMEKARVGDDRGDSGKTAEEEKSGDVAAGDGERRRETSVNGGFTAMAVKKLGFSMNWVVVVVVAIMIGLYVKDWIQSGKKFEN